jgi:hypothetical protein
LVVAGYEVVIDELRKAGSAAGGAGEQAARVDLGATIAEVPAALPGSRSVQAVAELVSTWREQVAGWSRQAGAFGRRMSSSADLYSASNEAAERDLAPSLFGLL